jgi:hypothetical protein
MDTQNNEQLWQLAKKRVTFKKTLAAYFGVNSFLVLIWFFTSRGYNNYFWPIWPMLGMGIALFKSYIDAYHGNDLFSIEKEYENLKQKAQ